MSKRGWQRIEDYVHDNPVPPKPREEFETTVIDKQPEKPLTSATPPKPKSIWLHVIGVDFGLPFIALGAGGAFCVLGIQRFVLAYWLFAFSGLGLIAHWFVAEPVDDRRLRLKRFPQQIGEKKSYYSALLGGIAVLAAMTVACILGTRSAQLGSERDDVQGHLMMTFSTANSDDVIHSRFSVKNDSQFDISERHQILCLVNLMVNHVGFPVMEGMFSIQASDGNGWYLGGGHPPKEEVENRGASIVAHTDSETDSCLSVLNYTAPAPIDCVDMVVDFGYYLPDQPEVQHHRERKVFDRRYGWSGQPINSKRDYCFAALSEDQQNLRRGRLLQEGRVFFPN